MRLPLLAGVLLSVASAASPRQRTKRDVANPSVARWNSVAHNAIYIETGGAYEFKTVMHDFTPFDSLNIDCGTCSGDVKLIFGPKCYAQYDPATVWEDTYEIVLGGWSQTMSVGRLYPKAPNGIATTPYWLTHGPGCGTGAGCDDPVAAAKFWMDRRGSMNFRVEDGRAIVMDTNTNEEWFNFQVAAIEKAKAKCIMVTTDSTLTGSFIINPVVSPASACSCEQTINAGDTAIGLGTLLGDAAVPFKEQWSVTAEVLLDNLNSIVGQERPILTVSTTDIYKNFKIVVPADCLSGDLEGPDFPSFPTIYGCIDHCINNVPSCNAVVWMPTSTRDDNRCYTKDSLCSNLEHLQPPYNHWNDGMTAAYDLNGGAGRRRKRRHHGQEEGTDSQFCEAIMPGISLTQTNGIAGSGFMKYKSCTADKKVKSGTHVTLNPTAIKAGVWTKWELGHRYDETAREFLWYWNVNGEEVYTNENHRLVLYHGEAEIGTTTVDGTWSAIDQMYDNDLNSFHHSANAESDPSTDVPAWIQIDFHAEHTVEGIVMDLRQTDGVCDPSYCNRYHFCVILYRIDGEEAAKVCTEDDSGAPYLSADGMKIALSFRDGVPNVKKIKFTWLKDYAQVAELKIYGDPSSHLMWLNKLPRFWAALESVNSGQQTADGTVRNVKYHTCKMGAHLREACIDHWAAWSACSATCGGGTKTRNGWIGGVAQTAQQVCNHNACPLNQFGQSCQCTNGNKWMCEKGHSCPAWHTCQRVALDDEAMHCIPVNLGQCTSWGDPHVVTFDKAQNDVYGSARYILAQPSVAPTETGGVTWVMIMETRPYGRVAVATNFQLQVSIEVSDTRTDSYTITTHEDARVEYVWDIEGVDTFYEFESYINLKRTSGWAYYETPFGVRVWHNKHFYFSMHVPYAYHEKMEGLCADFNFDKTNDFTKRDGTVMPYIEGGNIWAATQSEYETAISWIITGDAGPHPGDIASEHETCEHRDKCTSMFDHAWLDNCRAVVDTTSYVNACLVDYCEVPNDVTFQGIYEGFINECKSLLPDDQAICIWKTQLGFDACPVGREWHGCKPQCEAMASCDTTVNCNDAIKDEGCFCSGGKVLFEGECIDTSDCPLPMCGTIVQEQELRIHDNHINSVRDYKLGTVDYEKQYMHQVEVKFNSFDLNANPAIRQNIFHAMQMENGGGNNMGERCDKRTDHLSLNTQQSEQRGEIPHWLHHGNYFYYNSCHNTVDNTAQFDFIEEMFMTEAEIMPFIKVGEYQTWRFGRRRDPITGNYVIFLTIDDQSVVSYTNDSPLRMEGVDIWVGKRKYDQATGAVEWTSADFYMKNYFFFTTPSYTDLDECAGGVWSPWSTCTQACGGGTRDRYGIFDGGVKRQTFGCNTNPCTFDPTIYPVCTCPSGEWSCRADCARGSFCQRISLNTDDMHCLPDTIGTCSAWGDPHLTTWDGLKYDVYGVATYTFAQFTGTTDDNLQWSVKMHTSPVRHVSYASSWTLLVNTDDYSYTIDVTNHGVFTFTYNFNDDSITTDQEFKNYINFAIQGRQVALRTPHGLQMNVRPWGAVLRIPYAFNDKVEALCGSFNHDANDDFTCPDGTVHSIDDVPSTGYRLNAKEYAMGQCWMDGPAIDDGPIGDIPDMDDCDTLSCDTMFDNVVFDGCTTAIDPTPFIEDCKVDYCLSPTDDTLTGLYESFIDSCKAILPDDNAICQWKTAAGLSNCPVGSTWSGCKPQCEAYISCDPSSIECDAEATVEGCFCPAGQILYGDQCIEPENCPTRQCLIDVRQGTLSNDENEQYGGVHDFDFQFIIQMTVVKWYDTNLSNKWENMFQWESMDAGDELSCKRQAPSAFIVPQQFHDDPNHAAFGKTFYIHFCTDAGADDLIEQPINDPSYYFTRADFDAAGFGVSNGGNLWEFKQKYHEDSGKWEMTFRLSPRTAFQYTLMRTWTINKPVRYTNMQLWLSRIHPDRDDPTVMMAEGRMYHVWLNTAPAHQSIDYCLEDNWSDWSECSVTCGGGSRTRTGWELRPNASPKTTQETAICNTEVCPFNPLDPHPESDCGCDDGKWLCQSTCSRGKTCQRVDLGSTVMKCLVTKIGNCKAYGDPHITTFDGLRNDIYGINKYTLARFNHNADITVQDNIQWTVVMETQAAKRLKGLTLSVSSDHYQYEVRMWYENAQRKLFSEYTYTFNNIYMTDEKFEEYIEFNDRVANTVTLNTPFGVRVTQRGLNGDVFALYSFRENLEGVCGDYDFDKKDDYQCPDGTIHAWNGRGSMNKAAECWKWEPQPEPDADEVNDQTCPQVSVCHAMFANPVFDNCLDEVDPTPYFLSCKVDYCATPDDETLELIYEEYMNTCAKILPEDNGVCTWRNVIPNMNNCPANTVYHGCKPQCDALKSCRGPGTCSNTQLIDGCFCPAGHAFDDNNDCVAFADCPMHWLEWGECSVTCGGGTRTRIGYENAVETSEDRVCNTNVCPFDPLPESECSCQNDQWFCQSTCPQGQSCQRVALDSNEMRCLELAVGKCGSFGDPHVYTFDGAKNDVYGVATYMFTRFDTTHTAPDDLEWEMLIETKPYGQVSVTKAFTLIVNSNSFNYRIETELGALKSYTYTFNDGSITTDPQFESYVQLDQKVPKQVSYTTPFGVALKHRKGGGEVFLSYLFSGLVEGLCGDYDYDPTNDFTCPDGTTWPFENTGNGHKRTTSEWETAKCWKDVGDDGPDPGDPSIPGTHENDCVEANVCYNMFNRAEFAACLEKVDPTPFINACRIDYCQEQSDEVIDEIYTAFFDQCADQVPEDNAVCTWREVVGRSDCDANRVWHGCKPQCDAVQTCPTLPVAAGCNNAVLVEGCFCQDGKMLNKKNECVSLADCSDTKCGNTIEWDFGPDWNQVNADCIDNVCTLSCAGGKIPYPVDTVTCNAKILFPTQKSIDISCEVSQCGSLAPYNFDPAVMTVDCTATGCTFACINAAQRPNVKVLGCNQITKEFDMDPFNLECVSDDDTLCGNFVDANIQLGPDMDMECEEFNSLVGITSQECTFTCRNNYFLVGPGSLMCENGVFSETDLTIKCCQTECCDLVNHADWAQLSLVVEVDTNESSEHVKMIKCLNADHIVVDKTTKEAVDPIVSCDIISHEWNMLNNVECQPLACDFDPDSITLLNGVQLACTAGECVATCADGVPDTPIINCSNAAAVSATGTLTCTQTDCGNTDEFNYGPHWSDVDVTCLIDECSLSCSSGFVFPVDRVRCVDGVLIPSPDTGLEIKCAETVCGDLAIPGDMSKVCTEFGCSLTCTDATKIPNMKEVWCTETREKFDISNQLACIDPVETPCGDVPLTLHGAVTTTCDDWVSIFDSTCHTCHFTCANADERIYGVDRITCENSQFNPASGSVYCVNEDNETVCGDLDALINIDAGVELACTDTECTASCRVGYPNLKTITCDDTTGVYSVAAGFNLVCQDPQECGDLSDALTIDVDASFVCLYTDLNVNQDSVCTFDCGQSQLPNPIDHVECDGTTGQWNLFGQTNLECHITKCGDSSTWNFGPNFDDVVKHCHYDDQTDVTTCRLQCTSDLTGKLATVIDQNGNEVDTIVCQPSVINGNGESGTPQLLPADGVLELSCAETICGSLSDVVTVSVDVITLCADSECRFSCPTGKIASYSSVQCRPNGQYNVDQINVECVDPVDTPCGNVVDTFTLGPDVSVTCETFSSIHQTDQVICHAACKDSGHNLNGDDEMICVNGQFTNSNTVVTCMPTPCGDPTDFIGVDAGVNFKCSGDVCTFECDNLAEVSLARELVCNSQTKQFEEIILWPDTDQPFNVNLVTCERPKQTFCDDPRQYFVNLDLNSVSFNCDWSANKCQVVCLEENHVPSIDEVTCNPLLRRFNEDQATVIECVERETACGDLKDHFELTDSSISWLCDPNDVCTFSCPNGHVPEPLGAVKCITTTHGFFINYHSGLVINEDTEITCQIEPETTCGRLTDTYSIANDVVVNCNYHNGRCDFTCVDETHYIDLETVICDNGAYHPSGGDLYCSGDYDTACGNLPGNILVESEMTCADNVCSFTCSDVDKHLKGIMTAACDPVTKEWSTSYVLPNAVDTVLYSTCVDTMCGDMDVINIDLVTVDITSQINIDGFGSVELTCKEPTLHLTGTLSSSLICPDNTGIWQLENIDADIKCEATVCGNPDQVLSINDDTSWTCVNNVCSFTCDAVNGGGVTLDTVLCNEATREWILGPITDVQCENTCFELGTVESNVSLEPDVIVKCNDDVRADSTTRCDLICLHGLVPVIKETNATIHQMLCDDDYNDGKWMKLDFDMFGVPVQSQLGNAAITVHCDKEHEPDEPDVCADIDTVFKLDENVIVRCSPNTCTFSCSDELVLNTEVEFVYCLTDALGEKKWSPTHKNKIKCIIKEDEKEDNKDHHVCDDIRTVVSIESTVIYECTANTCSFGCQIVDEVVNVDEISCDKGEWLVNKKIKKTGVKCEEEKEDKKDKKKKDKDDNDDNDESDKDKKKKDKKDKNKDKDKDKKKEKENDKDKDKDKDKYEDYDSVYAVDKECETFVNYDRESVKTVNCTRKRCSFKCKRGYDYVNIVSVDCHPNKNGDGGNWSNGEKRVTCQPKY